MKLIDPDELERVLRPILTDESCPLHIAAEIDMNLDLMPKVDAVPVRHGRWIPYNSKYGHDEKVYLCDQCNNNVGFTKMNFCPNCGTDMRKDGDDGKAD